MMDDTALRERYPNLMRATFCGREAYVVLGPHRVSITYLRWLFGQKVSLEEALADEHLRAQIYRDAQGTLRLNAAHHALRPNEQPPRFLILVRSHNGTGPWKRRQVPGVEIELDSPARAPDQTGEFLVGAINADEAEALTG